MMMEVFSNTVKSGADGLLLTDLPEFDCSSFSNSAEITLSMLDTELGLNHNFASDGNAFLAEQGTPMNHLQPTEEVVGFDLDPADKCIGESGPVSVDSGLESSGTSPAYFSEYIDPDMAGICSPSSLASEESEKLLTELETVNFADLFSHDEDSELCNYMYGNNKSKGQENQHLENEYVYIGESCCSSRSPTPDNNSNCTASSKNTKSANKVQVIKIVTESAGNDLVDDSMLEKNKRNAIQARINRQKKKEYIQGLENKVVDLTKENNCLKKASEKLMKERQALEEEVLYLRNVLANQSTLSALLHNIDNVPNLRLSTTFPSTRRSIDSDHDYQKPAKKAKLSNDSKISGGVCLHVDKDSVSLEFCSKCAKMASSCNRDSV